MPIKRDIEITFVTLTGNNFSGAFPVYDGTSAYEEWLTIPGNGGKTLAEFFKETTGDPGTGIKGVKSSRDPSTSLLALEFQLTDKPSLTSTIEVLDGDDDFESWRKCLGEDGKTKEEFYDFLKGEDGNGIVDVQITITPAQPASSITLSGKVK